MASALGVNLQQATDRLFLDANPEFSAKGATASEDLTEMENPVLVVKKGDQTLQIPGNKSIARLNDKEVVSDGVNVNNNSRWFISKSSSSKLNQYCSSMSRARHTGALLIKAQATLIEEDEGIR